MGESAGKRIVGVLVLLLAGAAISGLLLMQHHGEPGASATVNQVCGEGQTSGCDTVARSSWSKAGGLPLAAVGLVFYASLAILLVLLALAPPEARDGLVFVALAALAVALVVDLVLLGLQAFAIKAFCTLCLVTYALNAACFVLLWPARRSAGAVSPAARSTSGRLAIAGWALGSLVTVGGVLAAENALSQREKARIGTLL
ncbi:MAG TPA: vitamin K epoxide reductase family protein, partial [Vicinamibacteria bacterium]